MLVIDRYDARSRSNGSELILDYYLVSRMSIYGSFTWVQDNWLFMTNALIMESKVYEVGSLLLFMFLHTIIKNVSPNNNTRERTVTLQKKK